MGRVRVTKEYTFVGMDEVMFVKCLPSVRHVVLSTQSVTISNIVTNVGIVFAVIEAYSHSSEAARRLGI